MIHSIFISACLGVALVATSARAFVQAPPRYAMSASERRRTGTPAHASRLPQRKRTLVSTMFAAEELTAATTPDGAAGAAEGEVEGIDSVAPTVTASVEGAATAVAEEEEELTYEQLTRKAKLEEIQRLRSKETFITQKTGDYECTQCSFVYRPLEDGQGALSGTQFEDLPSTWLCPVCKSPKDTFFAQTKTIAGFEDNQQYGFGGNTLTSGQKNLLIFGSLAVFFLLFLGGYLLE